MWCIAQKKFVSTTPQNGPLIEGTLSTLPGARYGVEVEILETDFGLVSEYVNVKINHQDFGKCTPSGTGTCKWYLCTLQKDKVETTKDTIDVTIKFSDESNAFEHCDNQVEARITLHLLGKLWNTTHA